MKFPIRSFSSEILFEAEIADDEPRKIKAALQIAVGRGANLSGANLSRADLPRADLSGANLYGARRGARDLGHHCGRG